ncbi:RAS guanyl-releasing protein 2-A-like [Halichondria panicea]|uniref:RAS guanyl-releasing protein 2-A-like n=1 Tax=Halichondria panicea TaxID=6063 RepID=UPI00312B84A9
MEDAADITLNELLSRMLSKFENEDYARNIRPSSNSDFDPAYPQVFLLTSKWYKEPSFVMEQLQGLYTASVQVSKSGEESVVRATTRRKWAIARVVRFWLEHFPDDFRAITPLPRLVEDLQKVMTSSGDKDLSEFVSLDTLPEDPRWFHHSLSTPMKREFNVVRRPSLGFDATSAEELAEIMCSLDYKLFRRIPIREFCLYAHAAKPSKETPRIEECIQLFNGLTLWVVCNILREFTIVKRADIIEKFIDTTKHLHSLHCYNTLLAVVGGLNHFSVRRLNQTWVHVDKAKKEELTTWTEFFSSHMNYAKYRQTVTALHGGFHIPVIGILLKDLVAVDSQSKDYSDSSLGVVNINKYRLLWTLLSAMKQAQLTTPKTPPDVEHMRILRAAVNQANMDDDALEELSVSREPRSRDSNSITRSVVDQLPKFSEWAAGRQGSLDGDTLSKHVRQMVDAVFRAYDSDNSGTISTEEFDSISSNFPFIEHFSVLDQDNDGTISYEELLSYFLSANTSLRQRFTHKFEEHTFLSSPVCAHCKGMMKGIVRQGVRCKDCAISCHKHCKDYVVIDCKKTKEKKKGSKGRQASAVNPEGLELYCDDDISLKERLQRAEVARDALSAENSELLAKLAEANAKIHQLQSHIAVIRQHTIGFILEQMNTLNPSMTAPPGTEV